MLTIMVCYLVLNEVIVAQPPTAIKVSQKAQAESFFFETSLEKNLSFAWYSRGISISKPLCCFVY